MAPGKMSPIVGVVRLHAEKRANPPIWLQNRVALTDSRCKIITCITSILALCIQNLGTHLSPLVGRNAQLRKVGHASQHGCAPPDSVLWPRQRLDFGKISKARGQLAPDSIRNPKVMEAPPLKITLQIIVNSKK